MSKFFEFLVFAPNSSDGKDVSTGVKRTATHSRNRSPSSCSHRPLLLSEHKGRTVLLLYPPLARSCLPWKEDEESLRTWRHPQWEGSLCLLKNPPFGSPLDRCTVLEQEWDLERDLEESGHENDRMEESGHESPQMEEWEQEHAGVE